MAGCAGLRSAHWVLGALLACGGGKDTDGVASISLLSPKEGAVVCGDPLEVEVKVEGVELVDPSLTEDQIEEGMAHVDVSLNGQDSVMVGDQRFEVPEVADGEYQLKVELSGADHQPITPYAGDFIYITVDAGSCE
jgi:hypothetical protein